jgi:hypothetical protein
MIDELRKISELPMSLWGAAATFAIVTYMVWAIVSNLGLIDAPAHQSDVAMIRYKIDEDNAGMQKLMIENKDDHRQLRLDIKELSIGLSKIEGKLDRK